jgi:hypothetical protein
MGSLSLGTKLVSSGGGSGADTSGFLLWTAGANYLTINAVGDKIFITQQ